MAIYVLTNTAAMTAARHLDESSRASAESVEHLASGRRINRAADDAAGAAISSSFEAKIRSINSATRTVQDALSVTQVAEGGLSEIGNMLIRIRELAVQATSDTVSDEERTYLNYESAQLKEEIERMGNTTKYLGINLLNGTNQSLTFQVGIENTEFDRITFPTNMDARASALGVDGLDLTDKDRAFDAIGVLDNALQQTNNFRAQLGSLQSRFHPILNYLGTYDENLSEAMSRIRDTDYVTETTNFVNQQTKERMGFSVLAQANILPRLALKLLDG